MKTIVITLITLGVLAFIPIGSYLFIQSDIGLLGDETCLRRASNDVLGDPTYGKSCPRKDYIDKVETLSDPEIPTVIFKFRPIAGREEQCPPISILIDRKTGEGWIHHIGNQ